MTDAPATIHPALPAQGYYVGTSPAGSAWIVRPTVADTEATFWAKVEKQTERLRALKAKASR